MDTVLTTKSLRFAIFRKFSKISTKNSTKPLKNLENSSKRYGFFKYYRNDLVVRSGIKMTKSKKKFKKNGKSQKEKTQ